MDSKNIASDDEVNSFLSPPRVSAGPSASNEEIDSFLAQGDKEEKYGTFGQQAITALEGAGSALTFGLSTAAERGLGVNPEDIQARREVNPMAHGAGELAGIGLGMLTGTGEAAALEAAGKGVAKLAGAVLPEAMAIGKIGSTAAKLATENALFQAGDETSKMFAGDPHQSVGTAMADIGLSGLLGAGTGVAFGSVSPLWKATLGSKVDEVLGAIKSKAGGIEGQLSQPVAEAIDRTGIELAPEVKAALSEDPYLQQAAKTLEQSDTTKSGIAYQQAMGEARKNIAESALSTLGKDAEHVERLPDLSKYDSGKAVGEALADDIQARVEPLAKEFEELKGKVGDVDLRPDTMVENVRTIADPNDLAGLPKAVVEKTKAPGVMTEAADKIGEIALKEGWLAAEGTPVERIYQFVQKNLQKQKKLTDLTNFISRVGEMGESLSSPTDFSARRAARMVKGVLRDIEAGVMEKELGSQGAELVDRFKKVRAEWHEASNLIDDVQEQIGVKASTGGYAKALREAAKLDGEAILRRIAGSGNAAGLELLQREFPKAAEAFKQFHLDSLLKDAAKKAKPGEIINAKALLSGVDKLSPEMRSFLVTPEAMQKLQGIGTILEQMEKAPHNFSNTARTADKLLSHVPGTAVGMAALVASHNPLLAGALGMLTKTLAKDAPDAMRLSMLKFIGSNQQIESGAFKAMVDVARGVVKGEQAVTRGARALLREGGKISTKREVSENDIDKLDKRLMAYQAKPELLMGIAPDMGHYLPDHATAAAATAAQAVGYLNSLRPNTDRKMPFDQKLPPDPVTQAKFHRALRIAENPVSVFDDVKSGTVTSEDIVTLQNVAPALLGRMREKLNQEIIDFAADEKEIPYKTRVGIAKFMGQPLDSTMTPFGIQSAQPKATMMTPQQSGIKPTATGMQKLSKMGAESATAGQSREMSRAKHVS